MANADGGGLNAQQREETEVKTKDDDEDFKMLQILFLFSAWSDHMNLVDCR